MVENYEPNSTISISNLKFQISNYYPALLKAQIKKAATYAAAFAFI